MSKIDEAVEILTSLGLPRGQQNERSALTLLALANLGPDGSWSHTQRPPLRIWDIMGFMKDAYGKTYAANTRETVRRQTIHQFEQARIVDRNPDDPSRPTNSGKTVYMLTEDAALVLQAYGTSAFDEAVKEFIARYGSLKAAYERQREAHLIPLQLADGTTLYLSTGEHNALQVAIIEEFGPRFAQGAVVLYVGDTAKKHVVAPATS
ncbi:MAG: BsuBI/PstI family type II restriction endonuclease [Singulisphaera sp.]